MKTGWGESACNAKRCRWRRVAKLLQGSFVFFIVHQRGVMSEFVFFWGIQFLSAVHLFVQ